jgi:hypothetical protein
VRDVVLDRRDVAAVVEQVSPRPKPPRQLRIIHKPLHRATEVVRLPVLEQQAVDLVLHVLAHAAVRRSDDRNAGLLRLMDHERRVLRPDRGHDDGVDSIEHVGHDLLVAVLGEPLDPRARVAGEPAGQRPQRDGVLAVGAAPDAEPGRPAQATERLEQVMDALGRDVGPDVAEGERLTGDSLPPAEARAIETVVQVDDLRGRQAEVANEAVTQVARGCDEHVDQLRDRANVGHPLLHPVGPGADVLVVGTWIAREVACVASLGALPIVLAVARGPKILRVRREHLHELPARAHQPVVM